MAYNYVFYTGDKFQFRLVSNFTEFMLLLKLSAIICTLGMYSAVFRSKVGLTSSQWAYSQSSCMVQTSKLFQTKSKTIMHCYYLLGMPAKFKWGPRYVATKNSNTDVFNFMHIHKDYVTPWKLISLFLMVCKGTCCNSIITSLVSRPCPPHFAVCKTTSNHSKTPVLFSAYSWKHGINLQLYT